MHDPYILVFGSKFLDVWHRDKGGSDGACGWSYPHISEKQMKRLKNLAFWEGVHPPMYTPVKLWFVHLRAPLPGQFLQAQTRTQATYLIQRVKRSKKNRRKFNLDCLRWPPNEIQKGSTVLPLYWFKREKRFHTARPRSCTG